MNPRSSLLCCGCATRRVILAAGLLTAGATTAAPSGALLLNNGNVLTGQARREGGLYVLEGEEGTFRIPASQVECVAATPEEICLWRDQRRGPPTADSSVELASWCLRQNLVAEAARFAAQARKLDPAHPALLELTAQVRYAQLTAAANALPSATPAPGPAAASAAPAPAGAAGLAGEIPRTAQQTFVRSVQPMLIHSCTASRCHHADSGLPFALDRWALEGSGNPTLARRNLTSTVNQIDRGDRQASPLRRRAAQPHGTASQVSAPLSGRQLEILDGWIDEVLGGPAIDGANDFELDAQEDAPIAAAIGATSELADLQETTAAGPPASGRPRVGRESAPPRRAEDRPRDAYDAEIFKRYVERKRRLASVGAIDGDAEALPSDAASPEAHGAPD